MGARLRNLPLLVGLIVSLTMHVMAVLPLFKKALATETPPYQVDARFDPEDFSMEPEEEPLEPETLLGIDRDDDVATMTWIGHEEYQEHLAQLAEVEQAAFTRDAAVAGQQTPESTDGQGTAQALQPEQQPLPEQPVEPVEPVEQEQPVEREQPEPMDPVEEPQPETPDPQPEPETPKPIEEPELSEADLLAIESLFRALEQTPAPIAVREETDDEEAPERPETETEAEEWLEELRRSIEQPVEKPVEPPKPSEPVVQPAKPVTPAEPAPKTPPGNAPAAGAEPNPGEQADQESDATSIQEVPYQQLRPGKPIARKGLAVRPQRPHLTNFLRVTAAYGNPLVEIRFAKSGRPSRASIVESSGDRRIDRAIESSLYRWRATGPPLEALPADGHVDFKIRIILNRRAR